MVWWCTKHEMHSIDEVCWGCDKDDEQPYNDAFLAGWNARDNLFKPADGRHHNTRQEKLDEYNGKRKFTGALKGTHDTRR